MQQLILIAWVQEGKKLLRAGMEKMLLKKGGM